MIIYTPHITPRIKYTFQVVFGVLLNCSYKITESAQEFASSSENQKIVYADVALEQGCFIKRNALLTELSINKSFLPPVQGSGKSALLFPSADDLGFDIFSAVFYLISRYEEYAQHGSFDDYGRYMAKSSIAFKKNFLSVPIIEHWVAKLANLLHIKMPKVKDLRNLIELGVDVDSFYAFKNRSKINLKLALLKNRWQNKKLYALQIKYLNTGKDPFDNYNFFNDLVHEFSVQLNYFILIAGKSKYHPGFYLNKSVKQQLEILKNNANIYLHSAFQCPENLKLLTLEKQNLTKYLGIEITGNRQHYLRSIIPNYYTNLLKAGIKKDYTMGYAEHPGFRAGISCTFPYFDLLKNEATDLLIYPYSMADIHFSTNLGFDMNYMQTIIDNIKAVNGRLSILWHSDLKVLEDEYIHGKDSLIRIINYAHNTFKAQ